MFKKLIAESTAKSPWLFHINAGSCNGCDIELVSVLTPRYDAERLGFKLTGTPRHAGKHGEAEHGNEELDHHQGRKAHQWGGKKHHLGGCRGNDGLFAQELEKIIERLEQRRAHALLHLCHHLAVDAAEKQAGKETEQEAGEDKDIAQILQCSHNCTHIHIFPPP